jgi:hypothetical protein
MYGLNCEEMLRVFPEASDLIRNMKNMVTWFATVLI